MKDDPQILSTVWCADCQDEHQPSTGMLGQLRRACKHGGLVWAVWDRRGLKLPDGTRDKLHALTVLEHAHRGTRPDGIPDTLPAQCERHGEGRVATRNVIGKRGTVETHMVKAAT